MGKGKRRRGRERARLYACTDKLRFPSENMARRAAQWRRRKRGKRLSVYRCTFCRGWHLGNALRVRPMREDD